MTKITESLENFNIVNKIQSIMDYIHYEISELENEINWAKKTNNACVYQSSNESWKSHFLIMSTLHSVRNDLEVMEDEIRMLDELSNNEGDDE